MPNRESPYPSDALSKGTGWHLLKVLTQNARTVEVLGVLDVCS